MLLAPSQQKYQYGRCHFHHLPCRCRGYVASFTSSIHNFFSYFYARHNYEKIKSTGSSNQALSLSHYKNTLAIHI